MRRLYGFILLLALATSLPAFSQQRWERAYGGANYDLGYSVQQTQDGGYIVTGYTDSFGDSNQVYLVKTNAGGDTLWTRTYGGVRNDWGYSVRQTSDGGYIVAGYTNSFGNGNQVYLVKTNALGNTLWTRSYGGTRDDWSVSVQQTSDGGYIIAGATSSFGNGYQSYLIKTNSSGDTLWTKTFGGAGDEHGYSVQQTQDGGYVVAGYTQSFGNGLQVYIVKTNASGDTLWTRNYGGANYDWGNSVKQTSDGGYIVTGWTDSFGFGRQFNLIKTNASGDTLWTKTYGDTGTDEGKSVQQTSDGGYIIAGATSSFGNGYQSYLIKTNASGDTLWTKTYGDVGFDGSSSVQQTSDGGYILAGWTTSFGNNWQVYLIKTDANGNVGVEEPERSIINVKRSMLKITPNPFTSFTTVPGHSGDHFALYDISGRRVGVYRGDRIGEGLVPGVYFLRSSETKDNPLRIVKVR